MRNEGWRVELESSFVKNPKQIHLYPRFLCGKHRCGHLYSRYPHILLRKKQWGCEQMTKM